MKSLLQFLFGAVLLAMIAWGAYKFLMFVYAYGKTLPQEYLFYLSVGAAAFIIAPGIIAASVRKLAREIRVNRSFEVKASLYKEILDNTSKIIQKESFDSASSKASSQSSGKGLEKERKQLVQFQSAMVLQAGERPLQKYTSVLLAMQGEPSSDVFKAANAEMIAAFRRDLGNNVPAGLGELLG